MSYIGTSPAPEGYLAKYEYTATEGQTVFACNYDDRVDVFINGILLSASDFTATTGTNITLTNGATAGDIVQLDGFSKTVLLDDGLPTQSGQSGKYLTTNGSNPSWGIVEGVPSGCILMWSGSAAAIPSGWNLCNGANGTPNLIGKFIKSASTAGGTGGSNTHSHSHTLSAGAHTLSTSQMPSHTHTSAFYAGGANSGHYVAIGHPNDYRSTGTSVNATGGGSSHSHSLSGSISSGSNEPAYFELCYIMKA